MNRVSKIALLGSVLFCFFACKKVVEPSASTKDVTDMTVNSVTVFGTASGDKLLERGICWSPNNSSPTIKDNKVAQGSEEGSYSATIGDLIPNTHYYYRAYCASRLSISYGDVREFTTILQPSVSVFEVRPLSETSSSVTIIYHPSNTSIVESGVCFSTKTVPTIDDLKIAGTPGDAMSNLIINGLAPNTIYFCRPYMTVKGGLTFYGPERQTKTYSGTMSDVDGNTYYTITIGDQVWMASNLRVTRFRNGDALTFTPLTNWYQETNPKYGYFTENLANLGQYGILYDKKCANDTRNIAPSGWRVPSRADWEQLSAFLKLTATAHASVRTSSFRKGTNESGFSMFGAGYRVYSGDYGLDNWAGFWLSDVQLVGTDLEQGYLQFSSGNSDNLFVMGMDYMNYDYGMALRCIKE